MGGSGGVEGRLLGLDLFRAVAVFGMFVAHVGPAAWVPGDGFGTVNWEWEVFHSRMPAMFAFAAGLSLNLGGSHDPSAIKPAIASTVVRAALLTLCGIGLTLLGTPVVVILASFGLWLLLALPFRRMSACGLLIVAGIWAVLGPALSFGLRAFVDIPENALWAGVVDGDYPALTWMPFIVAGLAVGRLDLSSRQTRRRLGVGGLVLTALVYGLSGLFLAVGGREQLIVALPRSAVRDGAQEFSRAFFRESGVTDTSSWFWLLTPAPHSGSWADVLGCLGVCALLLAVLLPVGDWAADAAAGRTARLQSVFQATVRACAAAGAAVLSVYAAHIMAMAAITAVTGHSFRGSQSVLTLAAFTIASVTLAAVWMARHPRGPLEGALARASSFIVRTGKRASAGWLRRLAP